MKTLDRAEVALDILKALAPVLMDPRVLGPGPLADELPQAAEACAALSVKMADDLIRRLAI